MAKTYYTIKRNQSQAGAFHVVKTDSNFDIHEMYEIVTEPSGKVTCTCPSRFDPCKHAKLLGYAQRANPDDFEQLYWELAPHATWIKPHTYAEVAGE